MADFTQDLPPEMSAEAAGIAARQAALERLVGKVSLRRLQPQMDIQTQKMQALGGKYQSGLQGAIQDYINTKQGGTFNRPTAEMPVGTGETSQMDQNDFVRAPEQVGGNPQAAAVQALGSGYGTMRAIGAKDLEHGSMSTKDLLALQGFDARSKVIGAQLLNAGIPLQQVLSQLRAAPHYMQHEGTVVDANAMNLDRAPGQGPSGPTPPQIPGMVGQIGAKDIPENWQQQLGPGTKVGPTPGTFYAPGAGGQTDLYQMDFAGGKLIGTRKLDNAPKVTQNNTASGPRIGAQEYFKQAGKDVGDLADKARAAQDVKNSLAQMANLDSQGVFSNVTSGPATFMANLTQIAGFQLTPEQQSKLGNTETYNAIATDAWQKLVAQYGGNRGVTKEEAEQIRTILPLTKNSPQARNQLYGILNQVADRNINRFKVANRAYAQAINEDNPKAWADHLESAFLPEPGGMPASRVPAGQLKPYPGR